ncbi:hypothetical protein MBOT_11970 [Mycobacterium botniense]|uniref:Uncharacterized protein n=1 Tax=Mycobacterium botniense TaxID=84962 RepID=A0A7I9XVL8_9MYCO|nr:hypothetical protein MBOT_11970 [Mycobacterium botniense]
MNHPVDRAAEWSDLADLQVRGDTGADATNMEPLEGILVVHRRVFRSSGLVRSKLAMTTRRGIDVSAATMVSAGHMAGTRHGRGPNRPGDTLRRFVVLGGADGSLLIRVPVAERLGGGEVSAAPAFPRWTGSVASQLP